MLVKTLLENEKLVVIFGRNNTSFDLLVFTDRFLACEEDMIFLGTRLIFIPPHR